MGYEIKIKGMGKRIREARKDAGMSQEALAKKINNRFDGSVISMMESENRTVKPDELVFLSMYLNRPVSYFLGQEEEEAPDLLYAVRAAPYLSQDDKRTILHIVDLAKHRGRRLPRRPEK